jgi:hypothetical protein
LRIPKLNAGAASLVRNRDLSDCEVVQVAVETLSSVTEKEGIKSVRLIKIDVEGYEAEVLSGADLLLRNVRPDAILFELNEHIEGAIREQPVIKMLSERDYAFLAIPRALLRMRLQPFDPQVTNKLVGHDFLAVARGVQYPDILSRLKVSA